LIVAIQSVSSGALAPNSTQQIACDKKTGTNSDEAEGDSPAWGGFKRYGVRIDPGQAPESVPDGDIAYPAMRPASQDRVF
jgi:hypothetical protein